MPDPTDRRPTLALLFGVDGDEGGEARDARAAAHAAAIAATRAFAELRAGAAATLPPSQWAAVADGLARHARALLDVPLPDVLLAAWSRRRELRAYCDRAAYPPDRPVTVSLAKHSVSWSSEPFVELRLDGARVGAVAFRIEVTLTLDGATLLVRDGRVLSLHTGTVTAEGSLRCEGTPLIERPLGRVTLPGRLDFGDGVSLCPAPADSAVPALAAT